MTARQLSDANTGGTVLGQSTADKIGFFGKTCISRHSLPTSLTVAATTTVTTRAAINKIMNLLKDLGLGA